MIGVGKINVRSRNNNMIKKGERKDAVLLWRGLEVTEV